MKKVEMTTLTLFKNRESPHKKQSLHDVKVAIIGEALLVTEVVLLYGVWATQPSHNYELRQS